ncbi:MAG: ankyrin repeat domain-containing protein [Spirochaetales bacterium]|nr:ankyrin repeat domain-containing protein [Spirochaetales bacterium]
MQELVRLYRPALLNAKNKEGLTALHLALDARDLACVRFLWERGAIDLSDPDGNHSLLRLHCESRPDCHDIVRFLIARSARLDHRNKQGQTALMAQVDTGDTGFVRLLLAAGADPSLKDNQGFDAIAYALHSDKEGTLVALLAGGACVSGKHLRMSGHRLRPYLLRYLDNCRTGSSMQKVAPLSLSTSEI